MERADVAPTKRGVRNADPETRRQTATSMASCASNTWKRGVTATWHNCNIATWRNCNVATCYVRNGLCSKQLRGSRAHESLKFWPAAGMLKEVAAVITTCPALPTQVWHAHMSSLPAQPCRPKLPQPPLPSSAPRPAIQAELRWHISGRDRCSLRFWGTRTWACQTLQDFPTTTITRTPVLTPYLRCWNNLWEGPPNCRQWQHDMWSLRMSLKGRVGLSLSL